MVIAFDFDGTVATDGWPDISKAKPNRAVIDWLKKRAQMGDKLILWTCRENYGGVRFPDGPYLENAQAFCAYHLLFPDNTNMSVGEKEGDYGTKYGSKVTANFYLDDASVPFDPNGRFAWLWWRLYLKLVDWRLSRCQRNA